MAGSYLDGLQTLSDHRLMGEDQPRLKRELGVWHATGLGLGSIVGTGVFVSIGVATGIAGPAVLVALVLGAIVALCNGLSSAQLAASHPVSGGTDRKSTRLNSSHVAISY